jgi:hypothetical protein
MISQPASANIGTSNNSLLVKGSNLAGSAGISSATFAGGTTFSGSIPNPNDNQETVNFSVPSFAPMGNYQFTISNEWGKSNAVNFTVGGPPAIIAGLIPPVWQSGAPPFPLTITGSGFGTQPTVTISALGVTPVTATLPSDGSTITVPAVSVVPNAPNEAAVVNVQPGYTGNTFVCGSCNGGSPVGTNIAAVEFVAPLPQIVSVGTQANLSLPCTGTALSRQSSVLIGQQIILCVAAPPGLTLASQNWSFVQSSGQGGIQDISGGFNVTTVGHVQTPADVTGEEAADPDVTQSGILFYFVNPGTIETVTVRVTYRLLDGTNSLPVSASASFSIGGPTGITVTDLFPVAPVSIQQIPNPNPAIPGLAPYISLGTGPNGLSSNFGVVFSANSSTTPAGQGTNATFEWVQLITADTYSQIDVGGIEACVTKKPLPLEDGGFPSAVGEIQADSPADPLLSTVGQISGNTQFQSYLMWDPALPDLCQRTGEFAGNCTSIPVPIGILTWSYNRAAINTLVPQTNGTTFTKSCGSGVENAANFVPTVQFPQWGGTVPIGSTVNSIYNCTPTSH